ncbi:MAG: GNAT family N-acetyltransferase [Terriglobia bacterium]|jgi:ribosomal-protein-alanine N-acetyltransferase
MQIRPFVASDLETLYRIDQECFPPGIAYSRNELSGFIGRRGAKAWVALANEKTVGFVVVAREPQRIGHIVTIDVIEGKRRAGVGKALMKVVEEWAEKESLQLLCLETAQDNRPAQAFYSSLGYVKVEEIPGYYSNGAAAWVMVKWL